MCGLVLRYLLENGIYVGEGYYSKKCYDRTSLYLKYPSLQRVSSPQKNIVKTFLIICRITRTDWQNIRALKNFSTFLICKIKISKCIVNHLSK